MSEAIGWVGAMILAVVVIAAVTLGGWAAGWWFTEQNAKREGRIENTRAHNLRKGYDYQQTLRADIAGDIEGVVRIAPQMVGQPKAEQEALSNQRLAQLATLCQQASEVQGEPLPPEQESFVHENCAYGAVNAQSPLAKGE